MRNKYIIVFYSFIVFLLMLVFPLELLLTPSISPIDYLLLKPYIEIGSIIIIVPSSTIIVYLLGIITIYLGYRLSRLVETYKKYWGITLILWGIGTVLAGTSYQGLGFMLKCEGQDLCLFTSWFELSYLYVTALSITFMAYAVALKSIAKERLFIYRRVTGIGLFIYSVSLVLGVIFEIRLLVTYEWFLVFFLPYFISFMIINVKSNNKFKNHLDKGLMNTWIIMLLVNVLYFVYFYSGIGELLYDKWNIWFSANDVLHVGLIPWMFYLYYVVKRK